MWLSDPFAAEEAPDHRESCINGENARKDQQCPRRYRIVDAAGEPDHGENEAEIAAADIAEKNLGWRPVPQQKAQ